LVREPEFDSFYSPQQMLRNNLIQIIGRVHCRIGEAAIFPRDGSCLGRALPEPIG